MAQHNCIFPEQLASLRSCINSPDLNGITDHESCGILLALRVRHTRIYIITNSWLIVQISSQILHSLSDKEWKFDHRWRHIRRSDEPKDQRDRTEREGPPRGLVWENFSPIHSWEMDRWSQALEHMLMEFSLWWIAADAILGTTWKVTNIFRKTKSPHSDTSRSWVGDFPETKPWESLLFFFQNLACGRWWKTYSRTLEFWRPTADLLTRMHLQQVCILLHSNLIRNTDRKAWAWDIYLSTSFPLQKRTLWQYPPTLHV